MKMRNLNIIAICSLMLLLMACSKKETRVALPNGSISFDFPADKDTIQMPMSILQDATTVLEMKAALTGSTDAGDHNIIFAVDSTKINDYKAKYGAATLLPALNYLFYKPTAVLAAGTAKSDVAQLNIGAQTRLTEYSTYVLPVVIKSVDGNIEGAATSRVIYYVFKTGKPLFVNKTGWTIAGQSSINGTFVAANVLDANNTTTYWTSNITQTMPQWVSINLGKDITFVGVAYWLPTALKYPTLGGYPTSILIETSTNGTTWVNKGTYTGNIVNNTQTINIGTTTARYVRFTSLACVKYNAMYDAIFISGISLVP